MNHHKSRATRDSRLWFTLIAAALVAVVIVLLESGKATAQADRETQVREFVAAFNARDIEAMLGAVDENVQWLSVKEANITTETEGKKALRESMQRYFRSCPSCKSSLEQIQTAGSRVTAMERASWTGKSGLKSQRGLSVYEFRNGKILRVYYFPADVDVTSSQ